MKPRFLSPLSSTQKALLCVRAKQAWQVARQRGAIDDDVTAEEYREQGQVEACGKRSLRECTQADFLAIAGKWWVVLGNLDLAFNAFLNGGEQNEARRQMAWRLAGQVAALAEALEHKHCAETGIMLQEAETARQAWAYTTAIAKDKFGRRVDSLDADELEQLGFTIRNRANAKRGVGDSTTRNKKQRKQRRHDTAAPIQDDATEAPRTGQAPMSLVQRAAARMGHGLGQGHQRPGQTE